MNDASATGGQTTSLIVCIDDFGMHDGVNLAALELGAAGRACAVGCMVDGPAWHDGAGAMRATLCGKVDIGLHLDLTEGPRRSLGKLIASAYTGLLSHKAMGDEVRRQLDAFEDAMQMAPDFVDGHRHVHQLPTIRAVLVEQLSRRYAGRLPWIRHSRPPTGAPIKSQIIGLLGSAAMRRLARAYGFRLNEHLLGVYGFNDTAAQYRQRVGQWLAQACNGDVLMCHPAAHGGDALCRARRIEYDFYRGAEFSGLLQRYRIALVRPHASRTDSIQRVIPIPPHRPQPLL
ncbi:MAG TPA: ChbG/HpnK family deacetylase [Telluria sp.]|jgi:predicted glycoside hydrolase/deacetylase ChbG (UPF0249 family)|nr:ChbG/HpnK family deacetylase [Telluria sp.]